MAGLFETDDALASSAQQIVRHNVGRLVAEIEVQLRGLSALNAELSSNLRSELISFFSAIEHSPSSRPKVGGGPSVRLAVENTAPEKTSLVDAEILAMIESEEQGMHLDAIHEHLKNIGQDMTKGTLSVKLHRLVKSDRLVNPHRAHYALSSNERTKRAHS